MGASKNQSQPAQGNNTEPSGADKFFAGADHHMLGGRAGVDLTCGGLGALTVFGLAHKGIGPFQKSPAHLVGGLIVGAGTAEVIRTVTTDKKKFAVARKGLLEADQQKWQRIADETE